MNTLNVLQQKIQNSKSLDFGTIFNQSIDLYKKVWVQGLILYLIALLIMLPIILLFYGPMYVAMFEQIQSGNPDPDAMNELIYGRGSLFMLGYYLVMFAISAITSLLYAGFYRIIRKVETEQSFATSEFFYFFKGPYFLKGFMLMIVSSLIAGLAAMLCFFPLIYVMVPIMFIVPIFAFNPEMSIGDILNAAFALGNKKWGITFGLIIVSVLVIMILTLVTCGIGGLFLSCFIYLPIYLIYKEVIGFEDSDPINQIGNPEL